MLKHKHCSNLRAVSALAALVGLWPASFALAGDPVPPPQDVDCGAGGSGVQAQLDSGDSFVTFIGTCNEFVFIGRSGVTIEGASGDPSLDVIAQGLGTGGAQNVNLRDFTISAPTSGVFITDASVVRMQRMTIAGTRDGMGITRNSVARIQDSTIGDASGTNGTQSFGAIGVTNNSFLEMTGTTVTSDSNNPASGGALAIFRDSSALLRGGNTITATGTEPAIQVVQDSSLRQDNPLIPDDTPGDTTIDVIQAEAPGTRALQAFANSYVDIRQAEVTGDTEVDLHSVLRIGNLFFGSNPSLIVFDGDITVSKDSAVDVASPLVTINGDVTCADDESSLNTDTFAGTHTIACTDFNAGKLKGK